MSHVGKAYPWVQNFDTWLFQRAALGQMALRYRLTASISTVFSGNCAFFKQMTSEEAVVDYSTGTVTWKFTFPCSPVTWNFDLVYHITQRMEDWQWSYTLRNGATVVRETVLITNANPLGSPNVASSSDWLPPGLGLPYVVFNVNPSPEPWPP